MRLLGTKDAIVSKMLALDVHALDVLQEAKTNCKQGKQQIYDYQAMALYILAKNYNQAGANLLEIGTYYGFSTYMIASACPNAERIITLNPRPWEADEAHRALEEFNNLWIIEALSWEYLDEYSGHDWDLIFVDGDHKAISLDLEWWNKVKCGGLFLCHDYSPIQSKRACPPVFRELNKFHKRLRRKFDVLIVDEGKAGMAGWYKRKEDKIYDDQSLGDHPVPE